MHEIASTYWPFLLAVAAAAALYAAVVSTLTKVALDGKRRRHVGEQISRASRALDEVDEAHADFEAAHRELGASADDLQPLARRLSDQVQRAAGLSAAASPDGLAALQAAVTELVEMNQSFNLQYLELQQNMQQESRRFTLLSNIMKIKHDTARAAINNIR